MTPVEVVGLLDVVAQAWPWVSIGDRTAEVWADALHGVDGQDAFTAVKRIIRTDERPPTVARLLAVVGDIVARSAVDRRVLDAAPVQSDRVQARFRAINEGWAAVLGDRPKHDHRRGPGTCHRCETSAEFLAAVTPVIHQAGYDAMYPPPSGQQTPDPQGDTQP